MGRKSFVVRQQARNWPVFIFWEKFPVLKHTVFVVSFESQILGIWKVGLTQVFANVCICDAFFFSFLCIRRFTVRLIGHF